MLTVIGTDQKRNFILRGDTLTISETYQVNNQPVRAERVLVREKGNAGTQHNLENHQESQQTQQRAGE